MQPASPTGASVLQTAAETAAAVLCSNMQHCNSALACQSLSLAERSREHPEHSKRDDIMLERRVQAWQAA